MKIAVHGLGRMGIQIARKLAESEHTVIAFNRSPEPVKEAESYGAVAAHSKEEVLQAFSGQRAIIWLMLPAEITDAQVDEWLALVPKGSVLINGGNSDYRLTKVLAEKVHAAGSELLDIGTSGGIWGYQNGFCMMVGGEYESFKAVEPALQVLAAPEGAYHHFGESGSGHFVKMVHNGIEYSMMQGLVEGYHVLKEGPYKNLDLGAAGTTWQHHSVITSWLNELAAAALNESPELEGIEGYVAENGEGRWTLETAEEFDIAVPALQAALDTRAASRSGNISFATKLLAAIRNKFGGHNLNGEGREQH
jgi:6-phosphogluconate dehydrogenase